MYKLYVKLLGLFNSCYEQFKNKLPLSVRRMLGIVAEENLNYRLIMDGFYYDAEIDHITEVVKNSLYFAVLEGENHKVIRSTHDTFYFSIDDELFYVNYYLDFGPLNISCLYKYCCKLNNYIQYSQGSKRIVHYTTSNPSKRVNAAFLIGCFGIIYLKMEPKDLYRILLSAGGPFKPFVDASQGMSQYTIRLLDCFYAIQKTLAFNFFNFVDFNVNEYDAQDKLQNGDMNWLVPRKFLAFIGPTDSELMNGHPPDFYIKYFVENDVKTIIRLNNKVYNAAVFTNAGLEHHELFFPDGTVPSKQILLRFLQLSENARAAIAVHCKAGLGRTGSLIGAYIIKHYRLTAREAIAWMRICRPGSVIGQQQGWLEKIENWLWRQGSHYRLQHFGDGDKIPHHRYGIYSKEWPRDKEKLIKHVQRRKLMTQANAPRGRILLENSSRFESGVEYPARRSLTPKKFTVKSYNVTNKSPVVPEKTSENRRISKLLNKIQRNSAANRKNGSVSEQKEFYKVEEVTSSNESTNSRLMKSKYVSQFKEHLERDGASRFNRANSVRPKRYINAVPPYEYLESQLRKLDVSDDLREVRSINVKSKRRNQSETRGAPGETNVDARVRRQFVQNLEQTQGDKLNEIKARRYAAIESGSNVNKTKQAKTRKRLTNVSNVDMYTKAQASTSKKQGRETVQAILF